MAAALETLRVANHSDDEKTFFDQLFPRLSRSLGCDYLLSAVAAQGRWTVTADAGPTRGLPIPLMSEALDREEAVAHEGWVVVPFGERPGRSEVMALHYPSSQAARGALVPIRAGTSLLGEALEAVRRREARQARRQREVERLRAILGIAQKWSRTRDMPALLEEMAHAATDLLDADRASIFLWDRHTRSLVGRPALGVAEGELTIADDVGVVGRVVHSGRPMRVDESQQPDQIDHKVDAQLGYHTQSLVCVPLCSPDGEVLGAFEALNKRAGAFTDEDEQTLVELAAQAAVALENAQDRQQLLSANRQLTAEAAAGTELIGRSPPIEALRSIVRRVADTDLAVLILGENGTGKEVVARSMHYLSRRRGSPFVAVNCAAIPDTLAESELFGHEKGAFTDAHERRAGKFELAADGTLFLDEIGDLSLGGQSKLLRVLEERLFVRVGGSTPLHTEARVVAATNQNLAEMVRQRRFREDLYFRLNVVTLELPPLRERSEDVLLLAEHFLAEFSAKARRKVPTFTAAARRRLQSHPWPGNVRELKNLMERLAYLSTSDRIEAEDLAFILSPREAASPSAAAEAHTLAEATADFQIDFINRAIAQAGGRVSQAAANLGLHRSNLYRKMQQLGMRLPE